MANADKTFILFTYGTLMRGELNEYLLDGAKFLAVAKTKPQYNLFSIPGNYPFPALMEGGNTAVTGEVYEVHMAAQAIMDQIEGHPHNYCRKPVAIDWVQANKENKDVLDIVENDSATEALLQRIFKKTIAYILVNKDWTEFASPIESGDWRKR